jgi:hypothetical protein
MRSDGLKATNKFRDWPGATENELLLREKAFRFGASIDAVPDKVLPPMLEIVTAVWRVSAVDVSPKSTESGCTFNIGGATATPVKVTVVGSALAVDVIDKEPLNVPKVSGEKFRESRIEVPAGIERGSCGAALRLKAGLSRVIPVTISGPMPTF